MALQGSGEITVGDAPLQKADWQRILLWQGLSEMFRFVEGTAGRVRIRVADFRLERAATHHGIIVKREQQAGDEKGLTAVNLAGTSFLTSIAAGYQRYRVTQYDPDTMARHHNLEKNEYLIANSVWMPVY